MAPSSSNSDDQTASSSAFLSPAHTSRADSFAVREKYKGLVRQLPAKVFIDKLVAMFMRKFNWQYYFVDPDIFYAQLKEWNSLPFSIFSSEGPQGISADLRVFPAVLFQMIATALLVLPDEEEREFATLKYAANMTFEDLACDYSQSGADIVGLFGKKGLSVTTVQAEFLRASFMKFTANVTESVSLDLGELKCAVLRDYSMKVREKLMLAFCSGTWLALPSETPKSWACTVTVLIPNQQEQVWKASSRTNGSLKDGANYT